MDILRYLKAIRGKKVKPATVEKFTKAFYDHREAAIQSAVQNRLNELRAKKVIDEATLTKVLELLLSGEQVEGFTFVPTKKVELNQHVTGLTEEGCPEGQTLCITGVRVAKKKIED